MKMLFAMLALTPLVGCQQSTSQSSVDAKVADTRHDVATKEVAALQEQSRTQAASAYDVAITEAEGRYKITRAQCDALNGDSKHSCVDRADAALALSKADAEAARKATGG
jgi:thiamine biosynthesis lipoprotein ApbE